jgi:hypothetical protein
MKIYDRPWKVRLLTLGVCGVAFAAFSMIPGKREASQAAGTGDSEVDILAMLAGRSPGDRPDGLLASSKPIRPASAGMPREYAMPRTRERVTPPASLQEPGHPFAEAPAYPQGTRALPVEEIARVPDTSYFPLPAGDNSVGPTPLPRRNASVPPGGGTSPPGVGVPPDVGGTPGNPPGGFPPGGGPPPSAVPEPATWATMIVGFGAVGLLLRMARRRARAGREQASAG